MDVTFKGNDVGAIVYKLDQSDKNTKIYGHSLPINTLAWDGIDTLASGSEDRTIRIWKWDHSSNMLIAHGSALRAHRGGIIHLEFAHIRDYMVSYGTDQNLILWNKKKALCIFNINCIDFFVNINTMTKSISTTIMTPKSILNEWCQKHQTKAIYENIFDTPSEQWSCKVKVIFFQEKYVCTSKLHRKKKDAENESASRCYRILKEVEDRHNQSLLPNLLKEHIPHLWCDVENMIPQENLLEMTEKVKGKISWFIGPNWKGKLPCDERVKIVKSPYAITDAADIELILELHDELKKMQDLKCTCHIIISNDSLFCTALKALKRRFPNAILFLQTKTELKEIN